MKILQLCYEFPPVGGGGSRVVYGLSRELARRGHEVHVVTMGFRDLPSREVIDGVAVHRVRGIRRRKDRCTLPEIAHHMLMARSELRSLLEAHQFDINHTHFILPGGLLAAWLRDITGLPYVITAHGSDVPGYNPHRLRLAHRLSRRGWDRAVRDASAVICPSRAIQGLVHRRAPGLDTVIIPYGFDTGRYRIDQTRKKQILVVSRLLRRKGVQFLIEAVDGLDIGHEIHIVGDGPYLQTLRRMAKRSTARIVLHGWLDNRSPELIHLSESSEIFVLPSERENFPVALMEAMSAGLAIITSRGTGCAELVGDAAKLVNPRDPAELRRALLSLTCDPARCRELGRAARRRLEEEFSWETVGDRYLELYERHRAGSAGI